MELQEIDALCTQLRKDIIEMIYNAGSGHPGGSLSAIDLMAVLFFNVMKHDPENPDDPNRDRFILSKGHCTPAYYSVLARARYFHTDELSTFRKINSRLQGHPDRSKFSLMETTSGSLGQGLSIAAGKAFAMKLDNNPSKVYCMLGDGELDEGQVWESLATIKKYNLSNLIIIVDRNNVQLDGHGSEIKDLEPLSDKFVAFGYEVVELDGHNLQQILDGLNHAKIMSMNGKNVIIISHTIKGKGVSFMENTSEWHGKAPNKEQYEKAMKELERLGKNMSAGQDG